MSVAANQQRTFLRLLAEIRPHWHTDTNLPARIQQAIAREKSFGSRDRRLYRELIYTTIRYLPWIEPQLDAAPAEAVRRIAWLAADLPATRPFRAEFATGEMPAGDREQLLPAWFRAHCPELFAPEELATQLRRAPLWLRVQSENRAAFESEFHTRGWRFSYSAVLPGALRLLDEADVTRSDAYQAGAIEVQDLGSQLVLAAAVPAQAGHWLDACAGAGGKTLQLAQQLGADSLIDAHDIRPAALEELAHRARRAGLRNIRVLRHAPSAVYDGVLVDAPCSGSGTWRRAPHLKWTTTEAKIKAAAAVQLSLLQTNAARVRRGGQLIYATCSLSRTENEDVVAAFLSSAPEFETLPPAADFGLSLRGGGLTMLPSRFDSDGFFVARFGRR